MFLAVMMVNNMKRALKPWHWCLIAILIIETILLGYFLWPKRTHNVAIEMAELSTTYSKNQYGLCDITSLNATEACPSFTFHAEDNTTEYTFNGTPIEFVDYYTSLSAFQEKYPDAGDAEWNAYKTVAREYAINGLTKENAAFQYAYSIATAWYDIQPEYIGNNSGRYTITLTTKRAEWDAVFDKYLKLNADGNKMSEISLPASIVTKDVTYSALAYMNAGSDTVTLHIMFEDEYLRDLDQQVVDIYIFDTDATNTIAHTVIETSFMASTMEANYRRIIEFGGSK